MRNAIQGNDLKTTILNCRIKLNAFLKIRAFSWLFVSSSSKFMNLVEIGALILIFVKTFYNYFTLCMKSDIVCL